MSERDQQQNIGEPVTVTRTRFLKLAAEVMAYYSKVLSPTN